MICCPHCQTSLPEQANFCYQCGMPLDRMPSRTFPSLENKAAFGLDSFAISIIASLALTGLLVFVFHLPIFIFGAFLPFFWRRKPSP